jgi:DNA-binding NarL/FixJ family response regulator
MISDALHEVLKAEPDIHVVGLARDTDEAIALAERNVPTVAVVDVRMAGGGGVRAVLEIRRRLPNVKILAFSAYGDAAAVADMKRVGATEYLVKACGTPRYSRRPADSPDRSIECGWPQQ